jgi:outer membrane protein OmpA-like peptidoglycan-associated protein
VKTLKPVFAALLIALVCAAAAWAQTDAEGSKDHPLVTRMPGYYIDNYKEDEFAAYDPTVVGGKEVHWEGKMYTISYSRKEDAAQTGKTIIYGIYFDTGSAAVKPESEQALTEMATLLKNSPNMKAYVVGHTDNTGTLEVNIKLSADRADSVAKALVARGISATRLKSSGAGPYGPIAANSSEEGKARNRRVELVQQ